MCNGCAASLWSLLPLIPKPVGAGPEVDKDSEECGSHML